MEKEEEEEKEARAYPYDWASAPAAVYHAAPADGRAGSSGILKSIAWNADGQALLTNAEDNAVRVYYVPPDALTEAGVTGVAEAHAPAVKTLPVVATVAAGEPVYDVAWFPLAVWSDPMASCFAMTSKEHPIALRNAYDGSLRCSYHPMNHLDELATAISLAFSADGSRLYTGFENCVRIFDTAQPGRTCTVIPTVRTRRSKDGQKGLLAALAAPVAGSKLFAVGSFAGTVALYDTGTNKPVWIADAHTNGVSQLAFVGDGSVMLSGGRKDDAVLAWDARDSGDVICQWPRPVDTNQRLRFHVDASGKYLIMGQASGRVDVYDLQAALASGTPGEPVLQWQAHQSCAVAAQFHPAWPLIATGGGQRELDLPYRDAADDVDLPPPPPPVDTSLRIWRLGAPWTSAQPDL